MNGGEVKINDAVIPCGPDGWIMPDPEHIDLQGGVCENFKNSVGAVLTAKFPCESYIPG